jgi:hypothetical protein
MKKINSVRNYLLMVLLIGGIFMTGALPSVNAQSDGGTFGGAGRDNGGFLGSGNRGDGWMIVSGTITEDGSGTIGSGTLSNRMGSGVGLAEDGKFLGSGGGVESSLASVWEFFFQDF